MRPVYPWDDVEDGVVPEPPIAVEEALHTFDSPVGEAAAALGASCARCGAQFGRRSVEGRLCARCQRRQHILG